MRAKVSGYSIERKEDFYELIDKVQERVDKGWEPIGGVSVERSIDSLGTETTQYLQAIVLWDDSAA
ncbi:MAG TPA: hypothetical protein VGI03_04715 [Verrucomicrobiae bacterium]|jgi:hypothetical protein